jgi:hypothetical protein
LVVGMTGLVVALTGAMDRLTTRAVILSSYRIRLEQGRSSAQALLELLRAAPLVNVLIRYILV